MSPSNNFNVRFKALADCQLTLASKLQISQTFAASCWKITTDLPQLNDNHAIDYPLSLLYLSPAQLLLCSPPFMSWFSILPANLTVIETWIIRFFVSPPPPSPLPTYLSLPAKRTPPPTAPPRHHDHRPLGPLPHLRHAPLHHPRPRLRNPLLRRPSARQTKASRAESEGETEWEEEDF